MKVGNNIHQSHDVQLPIEILGLICEHVAAPHTIEGQTTLAACCLVSRALSSVSTNYLYQRPIITPRSFENFRRTIGSGVASKTKKVGLEEFVKYLDLSMIAYESSKSVTARLIKRTSRSLEFFASPAITFGYRFILATILWQ